MTRDLGVGGGKKKKKKDEKRDKKSWGDSWREGVAADKEKERER